MGISQNSSPKKYENTVVTPDYQILLLSNHSESTDKNDKTSF